jgi:hypothetical protein
MGKAGRNRRLSDLDSRIRESNLRKERAEKQRREIEQAQAVKAAMLFARIIRPQIDQTWKS